MPFNWTDTLGALKREKSVLFLGPLSYRVDADTSLLAHVQEQLQVARQPHPHIRNFFPEDGFYLFHDKPARNKFVLRMQEVYRQLERQQEGSYLFRPDSMLRQIARIPFRMIINLGHHDLLKTAFDLEGMPYLYDYYNFLEPYGPFQNTGAQQPHLYNMLGDLQKQTSLLLTHKDLFDYLRSVFEGKSMAPEMKGLLNEMEHFIFLGMPFEKWYLQLLLQVLSFMTDKAPALERFASHPDQRVLDKVQQQFNIHFIPDNPDAVAFIAELHQRCGDLLKGGKNELSEEQKAVKEQVQQVKKLFMDGYYKDAMELFWPVLEERGTHLTDLQNNMMFRRAEYNRLNKLVKNQMANDTDRAELAKVTFSLLEGVTEFEKALTA